MHPDATDSRGAAGHSSAAPGAADRSRPREALAAAAAATPRPRGPGNWTWWTPVATVAIVLSYWQAAEGAGPTRVLYGLLFYLLTAAAAFLLGTVLSFLYWRQRAPAPRFPAAWRRLAPAARSPKTVSEYGTPGRPGPRPDPSRSAPRAGRQPARAPRRGGAVAAAAAAAGSVLPAPAEPGEIRHGAALGPPVPGRAAGYICRQAPYGSCCCCPSNLRPIQAWGDAPWAGL